MKNSGYVAVGHLLASKNLSADVDSKKALRNFLTVLFGRMNEEIINSSTGFWRFDEFFENIEPSTENMAKFLRGILKQPNVDDHRFELEIERIVWDMIKFSYDRFCTTVLSREDYFRLFCVFNRLCNPETLLLGKRSVSFLFAKFVQTPLEEFEGTFKNIGDIVCSWQRNCGVIRHNENYVIIIKKMYDDYVRDIIIESRVKLRLPFKTTMYGKGAILKKTISITSRKIIVYEDDVDGLKNLDVPSKQEPTGKIIHEMSLVSAETKISPESKGLFSSRSKKFDVLSIRSGPGSDTGIDIVFDTGKEIYDVYAWTNAIKESEELIRSNSSRLMRLQEDLLQERKIETENQNELCYKNQDMNVRSDYSNNDKLGDGLYQYSDMPFPPKKPERSSLKTSLKRKSRSLEKLNEFKEVKTPTNTPVNSKAFFSFSEFEQSNVLGFLKTSEDSEDVLVKEIRNEQFVEKSPPKHEIPKAKKTPPAKPVRKVMSKNTASKKRFQAQYIDIHTQKMSDTENKDFRSKSVSDFSKNEPDLILSCYKKDKDYSKQISSSVPDETSVDMKIEEEKEQEIIKDVEDIESVEYREISRGNSEDLLAEKFSSLIVQNFDFDECKSDPDDENTAENSRGSRTSTIDDCNEVFLEARGTDKSVEIVTKSKNSGIDDDTPVSMNTTKFS